MFRSVCWFVVVAAQRQDHFKIGVAVAGIADIEAVLLEMVKLVFTGMCGEIACERVVAGIAVSRGVLLLYPPAVEKVVAPGVDF